METVTDEKIKSWIYPVIFGSTGSQTRIKIIKLLYKKALNINQIAKQLDMSYKGIQYQVKHLTKINILKCAGNDYDVLYYLSDKLEENYSTFEKLVDAAKK